jgi:hypothetical protein
MKHVNTTITAIVFVLCATAANADSHKDWIKYFAGSWELKLGGKFDLKLVADGNAAIGTLKSANSEDESAFIIGWDPSEERIIHEWFGEATHGRVAYEIVDDKTLRGPGVFHRSTEKATMTVTITKENEDMYTADWTDVIVNGQKADGPHFELQRK